MLYKSMLNQINGYCGLIESQGMGSVLKEFTNYL